MNPHASSTGTGSEQPFRLVWTLGFAGKRRLVRADEARAALRSELARLRTAAGEAQAELVAVSSLAIGADLIFAEECIAAGIPWRAMLPFDSAEFLKDDFTQEDTARFRQCVERAFAKEEAPIDSTSIRREPDEPENGDRRRRAYLDCAYRVIEAADVVLFLWDHERGGLGGSDDAWDYVETLRKPAWCWNPQTGAEERARWPGLAGQGRDEERLFAVKSLPELFEAARREVVSVPPVATDTARQCGVRNVFDRLDAIAVRERTHTQAGLQSVITFHLLATSAAALSATLLAGATHSPWPWFILLGCLVAWLKPASAWLALRGERALHHDRHQETWIDARVAAELCRSALTTWPLPIQPEGMIDEEDFPRFHRLIRSLQTSRILDGDGVASRSTIEAACAAYVPARLLDQAEHFERQTRKAREHHRRWHRFFLAATWFVIVGGLGVAVWHTTDGFQHRGATNTHEPSQLARTAGSPAEQSAPGWIDKSLICLLIFAPSFAAYALAMQTIHDTRRRIKRYDAMALAARKQAGEIERSRSSFARLRLIAASERMLIEELHEWDAVTRHVAV